ncbi:MAG: hypothetical protein R2695_04145 [Acidimicrobiales bacterium]
MDTPATHDPDPVATAATIRTRPYLQGTITRTDTGETRQVDSRWTSRQIRWCRQNYGCHPTELLAVGTSLDNVRLTIAPDTYVVIWAIAGIPTGKPTPDFEQLLDLRSDEVLELLAPDIALITPDDEKGDPDDADPTVPAGDAG